MDGQRKNTGLYILVGMLCMLVIALFGYIVYDKTSSSNKTSNTSNSSQNTLVSKLDDTKDWVYDAEYAKNVVTDSYVDYFGTTHYAKDIVAPYINVNSSYASASNNAIKTIFDNAIRIYNEAASNNGNDLDEFNYKKYINNDNLSIVLTYGIGGTDIVYPEYYTCNIDLKTGNQLSYEEAYNIAGFNSSNIDSKVESAITKAMQERLPNDYGYYPEGKNFNTYNSESINDYKNSVNNNTLKYFLSDNGKLNIVVKLSLPIGRGEFDTIITVD